MFPPTFNEGPVLLVLLLFQRLTAHAAHPFDQLAAFVCHNIVVLVVLVHLRCFETMVVRRLRGRCPPGFNDTMFCLHCLF